MADHDAKYKAVFAYNHSDIYVSAVLYIYEGLRDDFHTARPEEPVRTPEEKAETTEETLPPVP